MFNSNNLKSLWRLLDWSDRDKAILLSLSTVPLLAGYIGWLWFSITFTQFGLEYISPSGAHLTYVLASLSMLGWLGFTAWGLLLRRCQRHSRLYTGCVIYFYGISLLFIGHMVGLYNPLLGVMLLGGSLTGFILFDYWRVLGSFLLSLLLIIVLAGLVGAGVLEYAPLFISDPIVKGSVSVYWVFSIILCSVPFVTTVFFAVFILLNRWRRREDKIRMLSATDPLTGLANRRSLFEKAEHELARAKRNGQHLAVCMIDLDHFKLINDQHGHAAGDSVLQQVSLVLSRELRDVDIIGRIGGEEFVLVLPDSDGEAVFQAVERCRRAIEKTPMVLSDSHEQSAVTASFGVFASKGRDSLTFAQMLARADEALYQAKEEGRNRVVLWKG